MGFPDNLRNLSIIMFETKYYIVIISTYFNKRNVLRILDLKNTMFMCIESKKQVTSTLLFTENTQRFSDSISDYPLA